MANSDRTARRTAMVIAMLISIAVGIPWVVLSAAVLFHHYSFFESVVVCLLVMILSAVATIRADFEPGGFLQERLSDIQKDGDPAVAAKVSDPLPQLRALLKSIFYGIAFLMALVKLMVTLLA
jgi:hypothetical protein